MKKIVFATTNEGKIKEIKEILCDLPVEVLTMKEAGIAKEIEETGTSFEENAIIKAEALKEYTDAIILADDSGLEIDALGKEPGVYSARYLGKDTPYAEKNNIILERLKHVDKAERTARYVCVIAIAGQALETETTTGIMEGYIGDEAKGVNGFGYDPIFYSSKYNQSAAELTPALKNEISHRGKALREMKEKIRHIVGE